MIVPHPDKPRTIRITKPCEFGDPGDRVCPEPYDVAALLVETRGVAVYEEKLAEKDVATKAHVGQRDKLARPGKTRKKPASP